MLLAGLLLAVVSTTALRAQETPVPVPTTPAPAATTPAPSPTDDLIDRVRASVDDLRYEDAIRRANEVFAFARTMRPDQLIRLRSVLAAAFYPDEREAQQPDSALNQLVEIVRMQPDAMLPVEVRWSGLDSLLEVARARTFAVQLRPAAEQELVGTEGRGFVDVVASRPARYKLRIRALPSGTAVLQDSTVTPEATGRLGFRAHNGRVALLAAGQYEVLLTAIDATTGDTVELRRVAEATGVAPTLVATPVFDTTLLKTDMAKPPRVKMVMTSLFFAGATLAIASVARAEEPIASAYSTDGRATFVSLAMIGAAVAGFWLDKGVVSVENLQSNMAARAAHRKALADAEAENKKRIAEYRVTMKFQPAGR